VNGDSMTPEERLQAVINLQVPDRVPVCPFIYYFAASYAGITFHELWSEPAKYRMATVYKTGVLRRPRNRCYSMIHGHIKVNTF